MFAKFIDLERLIHSTKTVIACIGGFLIGNMISPHSSQWIVITIIVVMCAQIYVGSVIQKAYFRFLGTLAGCIFAASTLIFIGDTLFAIVIAIGLSSFFFSYLATRSENLVYTGTLGAVTTAIIMLGQTPTLLFAFERFLEISIGILIAALVSQFILPIHASTHLRTSQATTLAQLRDYYLALMVDQPLDEHRDDINELNENIVISLFKQRQLAKESAREPLGLTFSKKNFSQTLNFERGILRSITFMHDALTQVKKAKALFSTLPASRAFNDTIIQSLNTIMTALESSNPAKSHIHVPDLAALKEELVKKIGTLEKHELVYIDGFLFSAEMLTTSLIKLAGLYGVSVM